MGRHFWNWGDACTSNGWMTGNIAPAFFGHAFFVR
jgi:hypothetical protein